MAMSNQGELLNETACCICGCTQDRACMTPAGPCHWVSGTLCSNEKCIAAALGQALAVGIKMRRAQTDFFKGRSRIQLDLSKKLEKEFDRAAAMVVDIIQVCEGVPRSLKPGPRP